MLILSNKVINVLNEVPTAMLWYVRILLEESERYIVNFHLAWSEAGGSCEEIPGFS